VGRWHTRSQFIVASCAVGHHGLSFRVFDENTPLRACTIPRSKLPFKEWASVDTVTGKPLTPPNQHTGRPLTPAATGEVKISGSPTMEFVLEKKIVVRAIFPHDLYTAIAVVEAPGSDLVPLGLLVDLELGTAEHLDIYGQGPLPMEEIREDEEDDSADGYLEDIMTPRTATSAATTTARGGSTEQPPLGGPDVLIGVQSIEQRFDERSKDHQERVLVNLYKSNRISLLTCNDWELHEQLLVEDIKMAKLRPEVPVACAVIAVPHSGSFQIVVAYESMLMKWWHASLKTCRLLGSINMTAQASHLCIREWPSQTPVDRSVNCSKRSAGANIPMVPLASKTMARRSSNNLGRKITLEPILLKGRSRQASTSSAGTLTAVGRSYANSPDRYSAISQHWGADRRISTPSLSDINFQTSMLITALDTNGGMSFFRAKRGYITKWFTCYDHAVPRTAKVDQILCLESSIAVQISTGDVRHIEFLEGGEGLRITDVLDLA